MENKHMQFYGGITPDFCKYYAKHAHVPIPSTNLPPPPKINPGWIPNILPQLRLLSLWLPHSVWLQVTLYSLLRCGEPWLSWGVSHTPGPPEGTLHYLPQVVSSWSALSDPIENPEHNQADSGWKRRTVHDEGVWRMGLERRRSHLECRGSHAGEQGDFWEGSCEFPQGQVLHWTAAAWRSASLLSQIRHIHNLGRCNLPIRSDFFFWPTNSDHSACIYLRHCMIKLMLVLILDFGSTFWQYFNQTGQSSLGWWLVWWKSAQPSWNVPKEWSVKYIRLNSAHALWLHAKHTWPYIDLVFEISSTVILPASTQRPFLCVDPYRLANSESYTAYKTLTVLLAMIGDWKARLMISQCRVEFEIKYVDPAKSPSQCHVKSCL